MYFCRVCWSEGMGSCGRDAWWQYICPDLYFSSHSGGSRGNWTLSLTGLCAPWRFEDDSILEEVLGTTEHSICSSQHNWEVIRMAGRWSCNWMMVQYALYTNGYNYVSIHCLKWTKCACRGQRYIHESWTWDFLSKFCLVGTFNKFSLEPKSFVAWVYSGTY